MTYTKWDVFQNTANGSLIGGIVGTIAVEILFASNIEDLSDAIGYGFLGFGFGGSVGVIGGLAYSAYDSYFGEDNQ